MFIENIDGVELKMSDRLNDIGREATINLWKEFTKSYDKLITEIPTTKPIPLDSKCFPNWATMINRVKDIGRMCVVIATTPSYSFIVFEDYSCGLYRHEDLTIIS